MAARNYKVFLPGDIQPRLVIDKFIGRTNKQLTRTVSITEPSYGGIPAIVNIYKRPYYRWEFTTGLDFATFSKFLEFVKLHDQLITNPAQQFALLVDNLNYSNLNVRPDLAGSVPAPSTNKIIDGTTHAFTAHNVVLVSYEMEESHVGNDPVSLPIKLVFQEVR